VWIGFFYGFVMQKHGDINMKYFVIIVLLLSTSIKAFASQEEFMTANEKWKAQKSNPDRMKYLNAVLEIDNKLNRDEQGGCYFVASGGITQIIVINSEGVVESVISESNSEKSECFKKIYLGLKYPKPPFAPIYDKMLMGYPEKNNM
jgi:activator of 2-hydroxyglutaryl-CoA dehydratase